MNGNFDNLADNGFFHWAISGNTGFTSAVGISPSPSQDPLIITAAALGPVGSNGFLTQNIAGTIAGHCYQLSFLLKNLGETPNDFSVAFNGLSLAISSTPDGITLPVILPGDAAAFDYQQFTTIVTATGSDLLQFAYEQDLQYFYLTGVSLSPSSCAAGGISLSSLTVFTNIVCLSLL